MNKNISKIIVGFLITYIVLYALSFLGVFAKWNSTLYYFGTFAIFFMSYFMFEFFQKNIKFNFAETYVGIIYLILLYLGYWIAFRIYYGNLASLNNVSFSKFASLAHINLFHILINSPYIYLALSAFAGWITFYFVYFESKEHKN